MMKRDLFSKLAFATTVTLAALAQAACAQTSNPGANTAAGDARADAAVDAPASQQHFWYDGGQRRTLRVDPAWVADFRGTKPDLARRAGEAGAEKSPTLAAGQSEVLRDETGAPRALPGGVIVRLREADRGDPQGAFADAGVTPVRALDPRQRTWLVEAPAGLESLALANRLHESGRFESATPNWWRPRALK